MDTKICSACCGEFPLSEFPKDASKVGGYRGHCKSCHYQKKNDYRRKMAQLDPKFWYKHLGPKGREDVFIKHLRWVLRRLTNPSMTAEEKRVYWRRYEAKKKQRKLDYITRIKADSGCIHCKFRHPATLEFHHRDPSKKLFNLSRATSKSYEAIDREIAKCDVLCANCHRILHYTLGIESNS